MRTTIVGLALTAVACACSSNAPRPTAPSSDAADLEAFARAAIEHIDSGELQWFRDTAAADAVMYDANRSGPVAAHGERQVSALIDDFQHAVDAGTTFHSTIEHLSCRPLPGGGLCTIELEQMVTLGDETRGPFHERITLVVRQDGGRLVWLHWHGSPG